jgi:hypothetical protein
MVYVFGMIAGFLLLAPLSALAALLIWIFGALDLHSAGTQAFFACIAAGGLGAVVSVLSRMALPNKFDIDPEVGASGAFVLGRLSPVCWSCVRARSLLPNAEQLAASVLGEQLCDVCGRRVPWWVQRTVRQGDAAWGRGINGWKLDSGINGRACFTRYWPSS